MIYLAFKERCSPKYLYDCIGSSSASLHLFANGCIWTMTLAFGEIDLLFLNIIAR